jgi:hypothetical protein
MLRISAGNLKHSLIEHLYPQRAKRHTGRNLYFIHVVDTKVASLFDPVFDEWVTQGMFGFNFRQVGPFND